MRELGEKNRTEQNGPGSVENASKKKRDAAVLTLGADATQACVDIYDYDRLHPHLLPLRAPLLLNAATAA